MLYSDSEKADVALSLLDENSQPINLSTEQNIFVFNENFIDKKIRINDDGLKSIILIGQDVDRQAEIDKLTELEKDSKVEFEQAEKNLEQYNDPQNVLSPQFYWNQMASVLRKDGGWADIDARIKNNKRKTNVDPKILNTIMELSPKLTLKQLEEDFKNKNDLYKKISSMNNEFPNPILQISFSSELEDKICTLLSKQINKPTLTEREKEILNVIQNGRQELIESAYSDFKNTSIKLCPYCYQPIEEQYRKKILISIEQILNKDFDNHKKELSELSFPLIVDTYSEYSELSSDMVKNIKIQIQICNKIIEKYKEYLNNKKSNIYTPIKIEKLNLEKEIHNLNLLLMELEDKRNKFNESIKKSKELKQELININMNIARINIDEYKKLYLRKMSEKENEERNKEKKKNKYLQIKEKIKVLQEKTSDTSLAVPYINQYLQYILFSENKLSIEFEDDKYYLKSKGHYVNPQNISTGERNIIALCYFFVYIMSNKDITAPYKDELMIVIDDPISSVDFENRVGITSFLKFGIQKMLQSNNNNKALILSHDISIIFDFNKMAQEICKSLKRCINTTSSLQQLSHGQIIKFLYKHNEYEELLKLIYEYAKGTNEIDNNLTIGNIMRRVLEAFSTFTYKKGIADVSIEKNIVNLLGDYSTYFENSMYRLVLHGESHYEEQIKSIHNDLCFYDFISEDEKRRTAKDILCFMYKLNKEHIHAYIPKAIEDIKNWLYQIPTNKQFELEYVTPQKQQEYTSTNDKSPIPTVMINFYDIPVSAGDGMYLDTANLSEIEVVETDKTNLCDFALRVAGNSMQPNFDDGDLILVKKQNSVEINEIGVFIVNGKSYLKQLKEDYLKSLNPAYDDIKLSEYDKIICSGKVIGKTTEIHNKSKYFIS